MRGRGRYRRPPPAATAGADLVGSRRERVAELNQAEVVQSVPHRGGTSTSAELDARDRDFGGPSSFAVVGACPDMCPAKERAQREKLRDLSVFERLGGDPSKTSPNLAVKKFCRSISTIHAEESDVRPPHVLLDTLKYLMKLLDSSEYPFHTVYDFVFDRTRSIRQDLTMQNIVNEQVVYMYEEMVKFHIVSLRKLVRSQNDPDDSSRQHLNMEQLTKTLMSLYNLYAAGRFSSENEAEFFSFYILLNLRYNSHMMGKSLTLWFRELPLKVIKSKQISFARDVLRCFRLGNYRRFLHVVITGATFLQSCLLDSYISEVQVQALMIINHCGYKLQPYSFQQISEILMIEESALEPLCRACGLITSVDETGAKILPTKQASFTVPKRHLAVLQQQIDLP